MDEIHTLSLSDGRLLEVAVSGPSDGVPLVFHHGTPGSAVAVRAMQRAVHQRGLRLVLTSRPGYGASSRQPGRLVVDAAGDVAQVLEAIGARRCLVAGWSGGGPHALACAARMDTTLAALVIAGVAPYGAQGLDWMAGMGEDNLVEFGAALDGEETLRSCLEGSRDHLQDTTAEGIVSSLASLLPEVDRKVLTDEFGEDLVASFHQALRSGIEGWFDDDLAFVKPWGFNLDEVSVPVSLWQGSADLMVPFTHGQWLSGHIPGVSAHLLEGHGHLSIGLGAFEEMLDELVEAGGVGRGRL